MNAIAFWMLFVSTGHPVFYTLYRSSTGEEITADQGSRTA